MKEHLKSRHVDLNLHRVWVDDAEGVAVFPLSNLSGVLLGYQQYRPTADKNLDNHPKLCRYYTYSPSKASRSFWGVESWYNSRTLFMTEGVFDAARVTELGYSAMAVMSNDPKHLTEWLWLVRQHRRVVAVCDPDVPGMKLSKYGTESHTMECGSDLGAAPDDYVKRLLSHYN